ncbi:recombinase family protein [Heyndrickxia vini]|uniref:Recombinase family protein n=1 Tax=Heyndrickxia vini TaxID=1476025 RepID=A0ABX7E116_9BACI|nr:recombinase family protein [Heyndrickxia vini]QQZ09414.1 recombinase family protein [Heyndrickxia vini]
MVEKVKYALGYCRRSSLKQKGNHSIEFQKEIIEIHAKHMGYVIVGFIIDDAVSAFRNPASKRKGMQQLYHLVLNDKASAVFFYDETRIDRSIVTFVNEIYKPLIQHKPNIKFYSTSSSQEWDPFTIDIQFKLLNASYESVTKSQRTIDNQKVLVNQDKRPGSRTPFGLKKIPSSENQYETFVEDENADIVRFIYFLYSWGYSIQRIADTLDKKVPAPGGQLWHKNTVEGILKRSIYLGDNVWGEYNKYQDDLFEKKPIYTPVIVPELHELVEQAKGLEKKHGQFSTPYTFRSIAYCENCKVQLKTRDDGPKKTKAKRKYQNYICPNCKQKAELSAIHAAVNQVFTKHWAISLSKMEQIGLNKLKEMEKILEKELDKLNTSYELLKYNESMIPSLELKSSINKHIVQVKEKLNDKRKAISATQKQITNLIEDKRALRLTLHLSLSNSFDKLTGVEKRMIALTFIEKVIINMKTMKVDIDFRLHPFIELENKVGQLTEINNIKMDA